MLAEIKIVTSIGLEIFKAVQDAKKQSGIEEVKKIQQNPNGWMRDHFNRVHDDTETEKTSD